MSSFKAKRVSRKFIHKIDSTPDKIFPLICPVKQLDWLDGWNFEMIYSESGISEEGCVFKTKHEGDVDTIWVITKHDVENFIIEYIRITPGVLIVKININLEHRYSNITDVNTEYIFTALSEKGNEFIEGKSSKQFFNMMKWWEKSINYYLDSGKKLLNLRIKKPVKKEEKK